MAHVDRGTLPARRGPTTPWWIVGVVVAVIAASVGIGALIRANQETEGGTRANVAPPAPSIPPPATTAPVASTEGTASEELSRYVLQRFDEPRGAATFTGDGGTVWTLDDISSTFDVSSASFQRAGFVDAYGTLWLTSDWYEGTGQDLVSVAMRFETAVGAHRAFGLIGPESWDRWTALPARGLGAEARALRGRIGGTPTVAYIWRAHDLVLVVGSQGALAPRIVGPLADRVQARIERTYPA
jgi:hypothetical protein